MAHGDSLPEQSTTPAERRRWDVDRALMFRWQPAETAPKDGTHILVCRGPYSEHFGFNQSPPIVAHYWGNPGEEGFYQSSGLVEGSYNDKYIEFTHWSPLGHEPRGDSVAPRESGRPLRPR